MGKNKGLCSICGKGGKLTFEHVPPKAAYNAPGTTLHNIYDWLKKDVDGQMAGGALQPSGTGMISLCKACNEKTGAWYVPEFSKLVGAGLQLQRELAEKSADDDPDQSPDARVIHVGVKGLRRLPLLKQIVAMLLAVNGPAFGQKNPDLVSFVLDKEAKGLPPRYRIFLSLFRGPIARFVGLAVVGNLETGTPTFLTEVAYPPFAYLMTIDSTPELPVGEISNWASAAWRDTDDVDLDLLVAFGHTPYPGDYRSKAALQRDLARNDELL